ncbi:hypothetical protein ILYODFUR_030734 [Ilyodon furcidens]|uniref:Uncharacterized protein n=1 Tax=Ilyodon furcidens TaxID=33524 RepID=A0ABV0TRW1_9TELE
MWVKSAFKNMTEHSGQPDPTEAPQKTVSDHSQQLHSHGSTLRSILEQQRQSNQQLEQMGALLQHALSIKPAMPAEGTAEPPVSQHLPHSRKVTYPCPEVGTCRGFLLQCTLVFNRSPQSFPHDDVRISYVLGLLIGRVGRSQIHKL